MTKKYAFITQGSWIGALLSGADADAYAKAGSFKVGMIPYAFEDGMDTILTSAPSWWAVSKEGNVEAALLCPKNSFIRHVQTVIPLSARNL